MEYDLGDAERRKKQQFLAIARLRFHRYWQFCNWLCWLIDPALKTLEAYELTNRKWTLLGTLKEDDSVRLPPFDAVAFPLDALWP